MKFRFRPIRLSPANKQRLEVINEIIVDYQQQGYKLTLRQLYYQLVSRDLIPNKAAEYEKLSVLLKEGRMGGIVDWDAIEDRLRRPSSPNSWDSPDDGLDTIIALYEQPRMKGQETYIEVWVEKDALSGVLSRVTRPYHIPILVNRGYSSASAMYDSFLRFNSSIDIGNNERAKKIRVLYLGDFDPSGVDMVRDVEQRIREFFLGHYRAFDKWVVGPKKESILKYPERWKDICLDKYKLDFEIIPVALTRSQIDQHEPPPNPAKRTDSRFAKFNDAHGDTSWEVDALPPEVLNQILTTAIEELIDREQYDSVVEEEADGRSKLIRLKTYLKNMR